MTSYIAQQALKQQAGSLTAPLLSGYDSDDNETSAQTSAETEGDDQFKKRGLDTTDYIIGGVLATAGAFSGMAMAIIGGTPVLVAGGVCYAMMPLVVWQRSQIVDTRGLRDFINAIREQVNEFALENKKLSGNVDELENQTGRLKETESAFRDIAEAQGHQVGQLVELVKENGENIKKMKEIMKGDVSQLLIRTVMAGDTNQDYSMDDSEVEILILHLEQVEFIKFDEEKLRNVIAKNNGDMNCIMKMALDVFEDDIPEEDRIFTILEPENFTSKLA